MIFFFFAGLAGIMVPRRDEVTTSNTLPPPRPPRARDLLEILQWRRGHVRTYQSRESSQVYVSLNAKVQENTSGQGDWHLWLTPTLVAASNTGHVGGAPCTDGEPRQAVRGVRATRSREPKHVEADHVH